MTKCCPENNIQSPRTNIHTSSKRPIVKHPFGDDLEFNCPAAVGGEGTNAQKREPRAQIFT